MKSDLRKKFNFSGIVLLIGIIITIIALLLGGKIINISRYNVKDINEIYNNVKSLNIDLSASKVEIKTGNEFRIEAKNVSNDNFKSLVTDGIWKIEDKFEPKFFNILGISLSNFNIGNYDSSITIYLPASFQSENLKINIGAGQLLAHNLISKNTDITVGAGEFKSNNLITDNITIDCGVGNVDINGEVKNKSNLKCGIGNIDLDLKGDEKDYNYDLNVGIGEIDLNNKRFHGTDNKYISNGSIDKEFKIDCGIGKITLKLNK
jgi:hypothetical protein